MLMQTLCSVAPRRYRVYRLLSRLATDRYEIYRVEGGLIFLNRLTWLSGKLGFLNKFAL